LVSDCILFSVVSRTFAVLDELSGIANEAGPGRNAGCNVFCCGRVAGDLVPLFVGRDGKTGGCGIVLRRIERLPDSFDEVDCLLSGCIFLVGIKDFDGFGEPDTVLVSGDSESRVTWSSDDVAADRDTLELCSDPQTLQKRASTGSSVPHL
jgi:hypothetical protein